MNNSEKMKMKKQKNQQTSYYNKMYKKIYNNKNRNNIKIEMYSIF